MCANLRYNEILYINHLKFLTSSPEVLNLAEAGNSACKNFNTSVAFFLM